MARRIPVVCLLFLVSPLSLLAQSPDFPPAYKGPAPTKEEAARRESLHYYLLGVLCERQDRLLEALKAYQKAEALDPKAPALARAQIALLLVLDRPKEALAQSTKTFELDPGDFDNCFVLARLNKSMGRYKEAIAVLEKATSSPELRKNLPLAQQIHADLAHLFETSEEFGKAALQLSKVAEILDHPDLLTDEGPFQRGMILAKAAETWEKIGHLHRKVKEYDKALAAYKNAQKRSPDGASKLSFNLAQVAAEQGKLEDAVRYLDDYLRLQPLVMEPYELKLTLLRKLKREADVLPWLQRAVDADRNNVDLRLMLGREQDKAGRTKDAEATYTLLAKESPRPEVYRGLFRLYRADVSRGMVHVLFQLNKAIKDAEAKPPDPAAINRAKAMIATVRDDGELAKELVDIAFRLGDRDDDLQQDTLHLLAALADKHRKNEEAERFYRKSLARTTPGLEHLVYGGLLRSLWKQSKYEAVIEICRKGLKEAKTTNHLLFFNDLAKAHARLGKDKEALAEIDKAIDLAGDQHVLAVKMTRIRILVAAGMLEEAETECRAMLKDFTQPGDVQEVRYVLSTVYAQKKQLAKAEEQLELILRMDPDNATVNNDLGYIWADHNKNLDKAEAMIRKALDLDKRRRQLSRELSEEEDADNAAYVDSLGWVLFRKGEYKEAVKELQRAVKLPGGEDAALWDHLGDAYYRVERFIEARSAWETAIRLFEKEATRRHDERLEETRTKLKALESRLKGK
ncbi:MAG: tetratricopeptide repeat protein [Gemmataceae bacterium]